VDLSSYGRVLRRYWYVLAAGIALAALLAVMSFYRVSLDGSLTPRKAELWQSEATVFLTESGFPAGLRQLPLVERQVGGETVFVPEFNDPSRFAGVASIYARLAEGDQVYARIVANGGPLPGSYQVVAAADTSTGRAEVLPAVTVFGKATTPEAAERTTGRVMKAFIGYIEERQTTAGIAKGNRVVLQVLNQPQPAILIEGRKRTLPVAVFLAVLFASIAFAFVLDNMRRTKGLVAATTSSVPHPRTQIPVPEAPAPAASAAEASAPEPTALPARWRMPGSRSG
jgi:hypothetical protein